MPAPFRFPLPSVNRIELPPHITDAGFRHVKGLQGIRAIDLWRTQITNDGMVYGNDISEQAILRLKAEIPKLKRTVWPAVKPG